MSLKIGFIGAGNMGGALAIAAGKGNNEIFVFDKCEDKAKEIAEKCGGNFLDTKAMLSKCNYVFLGVKPQVLPHVLEEIKDNFKAEDSSPVFISMAAGVGIEKITKILGDNIPVIRIMPNLPVMIGKGVILICRNNVATDENIKEFKEFMKNAGTIIDIEEKNIDAASAISGCGPAFAYMFCEALADGGVNCGLTFDTAITLAAATMEGAAGMVLNTKKHPGKLRADVCSPGGTTIEGVHALEEQGFRGTTMDAVISSYKRTKELAK